MCTSGGTDFDPPCKCQHHSQTQASKYSDKNDPNRLIKRQNDQAYTGYVASQCDSRSAKTVFVPIGDLQTRLNGK